MFNEDTVKNYVKYRFEADRQDLIRQVRKVTGITRSIYGVEVVGDLVRVRCYGGKVVDVPVSALPERPDPCEAYDNFTVIPGVGKRTAQKLQDAGIHTFAQLRAVPIRDLFGKIPRSAIESIELYLKEVER